MTADGERPICVVGAGRSGTSLAAQALSVLGVDLGPEDSLLEASEANPKGFWEQREIIQLNQELLVALGARPRQLPALPAGWETSPELEPFRLRIAELTGRLFGERRWGFKHPLTTLTLPLWRSVLGAFDFVICLRNPLESIASVGEDPGSPGDDLIGIWTRFTCEALRLTAGERRAFIFYEDWQRDPEAVGGELVRFVDGTTDPGAASRIAALFDPELHRERAGDLELAERDDLPLVARALHFLVRDLAAAERSGHDSAQALQAMAERMDLNHPRRQAAR